MKLTATVFLATAIGFMVGMWLHHPVSAKAQGIAGIAKVHPTMANTAVNVPGSPVGISCTSEGDCYVLFR